VELCPLPFVTKLADLADDILNGHRCACPPWNPRHSCLRQVWFWVGASPQRSLHRSQRCARLQPRVAVGARGPRGAAHWCTIAALNI
jgi:hypothetical protein